MTNPQDRNENVPPYGTPEYEQWYRNRFPDYAPPPAPAAPHRKSHKVRNAIVGTFGGIVALIVIVSVATSGGNASGIKAKDKPAAVQTTADSDPSPAVADEPTTEPPTETTEPSPTEEPTEDAADDVFGMTNGSIMTISAVDPAWEADLSVALDSANVQPGEYDDPAENGRYVTLKVSFSCTTGPCEINPFDFTLRGDNGIEYDQAFVTRDDIPELHDATLRPGRQAVGDLVFDLPAPFSGELEYGANILSGPIGSWKFALK